ncbi:MAG: hypothetical protein SO017_01580 [Christensenella minuta]|nr:hypothetical protein [Christensenella minuta]
MGEAEAVGMTEQEKEDGRASFRGENGETGGRGGKAKTSAGGERIRRVGGMDGI